MRCVKFRLFRMKIRVLSSYTSECVCYLIKTLLFGWKKGTSNYWGVDPLLYIYVCFAGLISIEILFSFVKKIATFF